MKLAHVQHAKASATLSLLVVAMMAGPMAMADDSGWYVGGNVGQSKASIDNDRITRNLLGSGFTTNSISNDKNDIGYKLYGGYHSSIYTSPWKAAISIWVNLVIPRTPHLRAA